MIVSLIAALAGVPDTVALVPGMVITHSVVIRPAPYHLTPTGADSVVIRIKGDDLDVDFAGSMLLGTAFTAEPDRGAGIGILIDGGRNVTVRRATIRGYKIGILARGVADLHLVDNDLSYNWKPRLWSGPGHESLADWLSFHHNEADEWRRYGAAIYLSDVQGGEVRGTTARQGMNGLLLVRSNRITVAANDFSFLSGLGIGLYRASDNRILQNKVDYCVRGYREGVYDRGQDSAALLLYEQSNRNLIAYNSMTHGGDGLFLWAGQSTMDSGVGGANDNLVFGNDFSFAVANGIEATFSKNRFVGNLIEGARYGLWGGYSYGSEIRGNRFIRNTTAIGIEHGQDNRIVGNDFEGDQTAINLWWNALEPSDWGYPKHRDTKSRGYAIQDNRFLGNKTGVVLDNTQRTVLLRNHYFAVDTLFRTKGDTTGFKRDARKSGMAALPLGRWQPNRRDPIAPAPIAGVPDPFGSPDSRRGRPTILVDEWGPYDWRAPRFWPARVADSATIRGPMPFVIVGPPGEWRLASAKGGSLNRAAGKVGDTVLVTPATGAVVDLDIELEYRGEAVFTADGAVGRAGDPYRFRLRRFVAPMEWRVAVFPWDSLSDPRRPGDRQKSLVGTRPAVARRDSILDYVWGRPRLPDFPPEHFFLTADAAVEVPKGEFDLVAISDDGVRVWIDDRLAIDHWAAHESLVDRVPVKPGKRRIRVEYYQVDGWVELRVELRPRGA